MENSRKSEYTQSRKQTIAWGLLELMMQMPYEKITVRDLCEHLQIGRKTFYRYFANKGEAMLELMDMTLYNIGAYAAPEKHPGSSPHLEEMTRFFYYWSENRQVLKAFLDNSLIETLLFRTVAIKKSNSKSCWTFWLEAQFQKSSLS